MSSLLEAKLMIINCVINLFSHIAKTMAPTSQVRKPNPHPAKLTTNNKYAKPLVSGSIPIRNLLRVL